MEPSAVTGEPVEISAPHTDFKRRFKLLLESPPALEQLLFREKLPPRPNQGVPMDHGIRYSTNYALYELRCQTNALLVRSLRSTNDLTTSKLSNVAFALWNRDFWFLDGGSNAFRYCLEHEKARRGEVPPSYDGAWFRVSRYAEILNLGLSHLWPGSVRWQGDRFSATGLADKKPMRVFGEIQRLSNGVPCELSVAYSNNMGVAHYRIAYDYDGAFPIFFPSRVRLFFNNRGTEIEYRSYEVLSIKAASNSMPEALFSPERFLRENSMPLHYLTNDAIYVKLPSGSLHKTSTGSPRLTLTRREYYRNRYFYLVTALITVTFVALAVRATVNKESNKPKL